MLCNAAGMALIIRRNFMRLFLLPGLAACLLVGCSSEPAKPAVAAVKPPEYIAGRTAFQKLYVASRGWNRDAEGFHLASALTKDSNGHDGKSGVWQATFASAAKKTAKPYTWCGSNDADVDRGVTPGSEDSYSPTNTSTKVFDIAFLKRDSDDAYATALKHGGQKLLDKDPNQPVLYLLDWDASDNSLVWHVIFGESRTDRKLSVLVNASSGDYMRAEK
jgi:hypothetical protein